MEIPSIPSATEKTLDGYHFLDSLPVKSLVKICKRLNVRHYGLKAELSDRLKQYLSDSPAPEVMLQQMRASLTDSGSSDGGVSVSISPNVESQALSPSGSSISSGPSTVVQRSSNQTFSAVSVPISQQPSGLKRPREMAEVAEPIRRNTSIPGPKPSVVNSILSYVAPINGFSKPPELPPFVPPTDEFLLFTGCERVPTSISSSQCLCGLPVLPSSIAVRCASLACGVFLHPSCLLFSPQSSGSRWRCPSCRAAMMMPFSLIVKVGGSEPTLVWKTAPRLPIGSPMTMTGSPLSTCLDKAKGPFDGSWIHPAGKDYSVRLISIDMKLEHEAICTWPQNFTLFVNDNPINVPQAAPGARSAPLLDISSMCQAEKKNVVRLRPNEPRSMQSTTFDRPFPPTHCMLTPIVLTVSISDVINFMLEDRCLDVNFARLAMRASLEISRRPGGLWKGVSSYDFCGVRSLWERERNGATIRASTRDSIVLDKIVGTSSCEELTYPQTNEIEVENESFSLTLRDPVSMLPLGIPVRGDACKHTQCIDLSAFLRMNKASSAPRWKCPICSRPLMPHQLWVDSYMCLIIRCVISGKNSSAEVTDSEIPSSSISIDKGMRGPLGLSSEGLGIPSYLASAHIEILDNEWRLGKGMTVEMLKSEHSSNKSKINEEDAEDLMDEPIPLPGSPVKRVTPVSVPKQAAPSNVIDLTLDDIEPNSSPIPPSLIRI